MTNEPYASVDNLIRRGIGANADEICKNLIGKIDRIGNPDSSEGETWEDFPDVRITSAIWRNDVPYQFPNGYVYVDAIEISSAS